MILTVVIAWVANKVLGSAPESPSRRPRKIVDAEKHTTSVVKTAKGGGSENYWGRIWGQKDVGQIPPPAELRFDAPTRINDPSRVSKPLRASPTIPAALRYVEYNEPTGPVALQFVEDNEPVQFSEIQRVPRFVT